MQGRNVFYPMGWDDNGLPTERRVQNYFHVRCEPTQHYDRGLTLSMAVDAARKSGPPRRDSRLIFIELCESLTREDEEAFKQLWRRLGLSVDWSLEYTTISEHSRRIAQASFLDLHAKGLVYSLEAPFMWDVDFHTAVAQADIAVGHPSDFKNTLTQGIVSNPHGHYNGVDCLQTDAAMDEGNSGGLC